MIDAVSDLFERRVLRQQKRLRAACEYRRYVVQEQLFRMGIDHRVLLLTERGDLALAYQSVLSVFSLSPCACFAREATHLSWQRVRQTRSRPARSWRHEPKRGAKDRKMPILVAGPGWHVSSGAGRCWKHE